MRVFQWLETWCLWSLNTSMCSSYELKNTEEDKLCWEFAPCEGGEALAQTAQSCPIPGSVQVQVGWGWNCPHKGSVSWEPKSQWLVDAMCPLFTSAFTQIPQIKFTLISDFIFWHLSLELMSLFYFDRPRHIKCTSCFKMFVVLL